MRRVLIVVILSLCFVGVAQAGESPSNFCQTWDQTAPPQSLICAGTVDSTNAAWVALTFYQPDGVGVWFPPNPGASCPGTWAGATEYECYPVDGSGAWTTSDGVTPLSSDAKSYTNGGNDPSDCSLPWVAGALELTSECDVAGGASS